MSPQLREFSLLTCHYTIPDEAAPIQETISRWASATFPHPAIIVYPRTEFDIASAVAFAKQNELHILPACGTHGSFISVTDRTLYLDLKKYNSVLLDRVNQVVTFGGGVNAGELMDRLSVEGYYTTIPDSNSVGMVGALLGGGTSHYTGLHGLMVDNVVSFRIITYNGYILDVSASSTGAELSLFRVLCGAGQGFGVIISATMRIYQISSLNLTGGKAWVRTMVFPPSSLEQATEAFLALQPVPDRMIAQLLFTRTASEAPSPGAPVVILYVWYLGPAEAAEVAASGLQDAALIKRSLRNTTVMTPLPRLNDLRAHMDAHVGLKTMVAGRLKQHRASNIHAAFSRWAEVTDKFDDARGSIVFFTALDPTHARDAGRAYEGQLKLVEMSNRERGAIVSQITFCHTEETMSQLKYFGQELIQLGRGPGCEARTLPNNMTADTDLSEMFSDANLDFLKETKKRWDPQGVFWSPYRI